LLAIVEEHLPKLLPHMVPDARRSGVESTQIMNAQQLGFMAVLLYKVKILLDSSLI
jgi:hypothetical protein